MGVCGDAYVCMCLCAFGSAVTYREHFWGYPASQHNTVSTSPFDFLSLHLKKNKQKKTKTKTQTLVCIYRFGVCVCVLTILCGIEPPMPCNNFRLWSIFLHHSTLSFFSPHKSPTILPSYIMFLILSGFILLALCWIRTTIPPFEGRWMF